jgi:hypothetical protein
MSDDNDDVFCHWEEARFPRADFDDDPTYGLVHRRRLGEGVPGHTALGDRITSGSGGGGGGGLDDWPGGRYHGPVEAPHPDY